MVVIITYTFWVECFGCITNIFCFCNLHSYLIACMDSIKYLTLRFRTLSNHWKFKYILDIFFFYKKTKLFQTGWHFSWWQMVSIVSYLTDTKTHRDAHPYTHTFFLDLSLQSKDDTLSGNYVTKWILGNVWYYDFVTENNACCL